jgi:hypothetical protein
MTKPWTTLAAISTILLFCLTTARAEAQPEGSYSGVIKAEQSPRRNFTLTLGSGGEAVLTTTHPDGKKTTEKGRWRLENDSILLLLNRENGALVGASWRLKHKVLTPIPADKTDWPQGLPVLKKENTRATADALGVLGGVVPISK